MNLRTLLMSFFQFQKAASASALALGSLAAMDGMMQRAQKATASNAHALNIT